MTRTLPPGVSDERFDAALQRFRDVVGDKWVLSTADELEAFRDPYPVGAAEARHAASAVVSPESTEQVQDIVRIANEYGIPLSRSRPERTTVTAAPPRGCQGSVDRSRHGERMNRILEVNEKYGYALLEPGVTYFDLYEYLQSP